MSEPERYDAIVIGSGQGGGPLAGRFAKAGRKTAIIERAHVGGACVNEGCTPTKTMIASARVAHLVGRAADYGVITGPARVDIAEVRRRKRDIVESFRSGSRRGLERWESLDLVEGEARFTGERTIEVALRAGGTRRLRADTIVINVGARPAAPPIAGLDDVPVLDSTSIMELDAAPEHLVVVGGGYIGLEFGQMFRRFGSEVTIIEQAPRCMPREDPDVCAAVSDVLEEDGIELVVGAKAVGVSRQEGSVTVELETEEGARSVRGTRILMAAGRTPNTDSLDLEATGVAVDGRGFIPVDDRLQTGVPGIYAIGDVKGGPAFTHVSYDDYRVLRTNLLEDGDATIRDRLVPYTVFLDPQLARVGLNEQEATERGVPYEVATMPMAHVARAIEVDETRGLMKVLVDPATGRILGCAVLGIEGGEIMSMIQIAMMGKLPCTALREGMFAHPTLAESLNTLFGKVGSG